MPIEWVMYVLDFSTFMRWKTSKFWDIVSKMAISTMNAVRLDIIANTTPKAFAAVNVSRDLGKNCGNQTQKSNRSNVNVSKDLGYFNFS